MAFLTGVTYVDISGLGRQRVKDDTVEYDAGGFVAEILMANGVPAGPKYSGQAAMVKFTILHAADIDPSELQKRIPRTVVVQTDSGTAHLVANAYKLNTFQINNGEVPCEFGGDAGEQIS